MSSKNSWVLLSILVLSIINWQLPVFRFTNHYANGFFALTITLIPFIFCIVSIFKINKLKSKLVSITGTVLLTPICLLFICLFFFQAMSLPPLQNESDQSFEKLHQIDEEIAVYRTNGGATTAYGIVVRQEKKIFPGVIAIRTLHSEYRVEDVYYKKTGNKLAIYDDALLQNAVKEVEIKSFLYF